MAAFEIWWKNVLVDHEIVIVILNLIWKTYFMCILLKSDSQLSKQIFFICFNDSPSKVMKNAFYFILKALSVLKIFKFLSWLFGHVGKTAWLERQVNFEIYDVTPWLTKNYTYCPIFHELKVNNEIWSVNRTSQEKYFSLKIMQKMRQGN